MPKSKVSEGDEEAFGRELDKVLDKPARSAGRPTDYTDNIADRICEMIVEGNSLRTICKNSDMPSIATIFNWKRTIPGFVEQYTRAKDEQADTNAEDIQELANDVRQGRIDPQAARVAGDLLKWSSSKLKPKVYGDKADLSTNGKDLPAPILGTIVIDNDKDLQVERLLENASS